MKFKSLLDVKNKFKTEKACIEYFEQIRWGGNVVSPFDATSTVYKCANHRYKCRKTNKYFNVRTKTIFENSNMPLRTWFMGMYLITSHSKGISSVQLAKDLGIIQKSAWFMLHRLRFAFDQDDFWTPFENTVEADETYVGGREKNKHASKRDYKQGQGAIGRNAEDKKVVFGIVERQGRVYAKHIPTAHKKHIVPEIEKRVKHGSRMITDEYYAYNSLSDLYRHNTIKHTAKEYVRGDVHTNTIENYWSVLKRGIYGIYHQVSAKHIQKYLDEYAFRYNLRKLPASSRFETLLKQSGKRLTYESLIQKGTT